MPPLFQTILLVAGLVASCVGWAAAGLRLARGHAVLVRQSRPLVPWGLTDLILVALLMIACRAGSAPALAHVLGLDATRGWQGLSAAQLALVLFCEAIANLVGIGIALGVIGWLSGATCRDFGVSRPQIGADLWLGTVTFFMLATPVFALQRVLTVWFPYEHPLISALHEHRELSVQGAVFFSAVIVAPIVEELLYRVLCLGGFLAAVAQYSDLRRLVSDDTANGALPPGGSSSTPPPGDVSRNEAPATWAEWFAIFASSALFALMHVSQGPAPIPLFVLALGLGYLYARTGRVLPCIVVHAWLNGWSLIAIWSGAATGA